MRKNTKFRTSIHEILQTCKNQGCRYYYRRDEQNICTALIKIKEKSISHFMSGLLIGKQYLINFAPPTSTIDEDDQGNMSAHTPRIVGTYKCMEVRDINVN